MRLYDSIATWPDDVDDKDSTYGDAPARVSTSEPVGSLQKSPLSSLRTSRTSSCGDSSHMHPSVSLVVYKVPQLLSSLFFSQVNALSGVG